MRNNKQYFLLHLIFISLFLTASLIQADGIIQKSVGLQPMKGISGKDWVEFNSDCDKLAVVETTSIDGFPALGKAIRIYDVSADLKPQKVLFELEAKGVWITECRWVGDTLVYTTMEGFEKPEQVWSWFTGLRRSSDFASVPKHVKLRQWPSSVANDFEDAYLFEPGQNRLFPLDDNKLLIINPLSSKNETKAQLENTYDEKQVCKIFSIPQDKLISSFTVQMPDPGNRWWGRRGDFIPLFVSKDNKKLIAMVSSSYPWKARSEYNVPFVIAVDLETGKITAITPDSEYHGLRSGRDIHYFEPGNPMPVDGGSKVVFNLNMIRTSSDVIAYFAYYDLAGNKVKEVAILKQDLKHAGIPDGILLTWTPDGKKVLFQSGNEIWLYDIENRTGKRISSGFLINDIIRWIDDAHLLVRVRNLMSESVSSSSKVHMRDTSEIIWSILPLS